MPPRPSRRRMRYWPRSAFSRRAPSASGSAPPTAAASRTAAARPAGAVAEAGGGGRRLGRLGLLGRRRLEEAVQQHRHDAVAVLVLDDAARHRSELEVVVEGHALPLGGQARDDALDLVVLHLLVGG